MTDPLSISASIGGLVTLADVVYGRIYKYVKAVKQASKDIAALSSEIGALYGILSRLRLISEQLEYDTSEWTTRPYHLHSCNETLEKVKSILDKDDTTTVRDQPVQTIKCKLRWPFSKSEVKELVTQIERHKTTLGLALNVDGMSGLLRALSKQDEINESMKGIHKELKLRREAETRVAIDQHRQKVLDSFGTIDPRRNHDMSRKLRHPNTGLWLTESEEFKLWLETPDARLWLYGIPGAGKTVLASLIIDTILPKTKPSVAAAYFYCDYKDSTTQEPHRILGSLAQQLAKQDEQSFSKLQRFHDLYGEGRKHPVEYDSENLRQLIIDVATNYDCTVIVIDGLDECGTNAGAVTELIANFQDDEQYAEFKILLLSRDEVDIRERLDVYPKISIAARNEDLRLYVGAEIERRTRKKMLNIKTPELRDYVRQKLVDGAEGMFRWVACQMDYLCELPNDAARRRALENLPHGLNSTYERLLRRVNERNKDVRQLVRRTLEFVALAWWEPMTTKSIREAISINVGDRNRDLEAVPEVTDILRHCSSLIRLSVDGHRFEFAHFTVQEFLKNLPVGGDSEFAAFNVYAKHHENEVTKLCLTYLNLLDFDQGGNASEETTVNRFEQYPFREYAVSNWINHARDSDWSDPELLPLVTELLHPSKPNNLISWVQDTIPNWYGECRCGDYPFDTALVTINHGIAEASAMHYAAMNELSQVCQWLVERRCGVNKICAFGNPLHCAQLSSRALTLSISGDAMHFMKYDKTKDRLDIIKLLLDAGTDPNVSYHSVYGDVSPLFLAVHSDDTATTQCLLEKGAIVDDQLVALLLRFEKDDQVWDNVRALLNNTKKVFLKEETRARVLQHTLKASTTEFPTLLSSSTRSDGGESTSNRHYEACLRTAAEYGQMKPMVQLLDNYNVEINAKEEDTFLTALHYASMGDHGEVARFLVERGANASKVDSLGKSVLHYCVKAQQFHCLSFFLAQEVDTTIADNHGLTVWHQAALDNNIEALKILLNHSLTGHSLDQLQLNKCRSLMSCASESGHPEPVTFLLEAGFSIFELDSNGCTALHYGAKTRSPEVIRLLIAHGLDPNAKALDGSGVVHYAIMGNGPGLDSTLVTLLEDGTDPFTARKDGSTPIHLLIRYDEQRSRSPNDDIDLFDDEKEKALQRLASLPQTFQGKQKSLDDVLCMICQDSAFGYSTWSLTGLRILLEHGANLMSRCGEQVALEKLLTTWQRQFWENQAWSNICSEMVLAALEFVPSSGPLHAICARSDLLLCGIKAASKFGFTGEQVVHKLLDHSPNVDTAVGCADDLPIRIACRTGCTRRIIKRMLQTSRASSDKAMGSELVREASNSDDERSHEVLIELLEAGLDPNGTSAQGETALMLAVQASHSSMVELLLSHGASAEATDDHGRTVAHHACCVAGNLDMLYALHDKDLDWNARAAMSIGGVLRKGVSVLHIAATLEDEAVLKHILDENVVSEIDGATDMGETALFLAACQGRVQNVALLLDRGGDPTLMAGPYSEGGKESSLHVASHFGHENVLHEFINHGYELGTPNSEGLNCEMLAWKYGHAALAQKLSNHIKEKVEQKRDSDFFVRTRDSRERASEPLRVAMDIGDLNMCKRIVQQGLNLEAKYQRPSTCTSKECCGSTPLLYSLQVQQPAIAEFLISEGASPTWKLCPNADSMEYSAFHYAAKLNYVGLLRILLERHSILFLHLAHSVHPIHLAIVYQAFECVFLMVTHPADGTSTTTYHWPKNRNSRLANQRVAASAILLTKGLVQANDTPLVLAIKTRHSKIAMLILEAGGLIDEGDLNLETPLHHAARLGDTGMVELLLEAGANPQVQNTLLDTPSMIAARFGHVQVVETLKRSGADLEILDQTGENVLHHAVSGRSTEAFVCLFSAMSMCNLAHRNLHGESLLEYIFRWGEPRLQTLLLNWAPDPMVYAPSGGNVMTSAVMNVCTTVATMKMLLRRIPQGLLPTLLIHRAYDWETPLYVTCVHKNMPLQAPFIDLLLDTGADPNYEGGTHGTPLMGACAAGRFEVVKLLVRKGANMVYHNDTGRRISALDAAKHFPEIVRWLLVGRFVEGPTLLTDGRSG